MTDNIIDFSKWKKSSGASKAAEDDVDINLTSNKQFVAGIIYLFEEDGTMHSFDYEASHGDYAIAAAHAMLQAQTMFMGDPIEIDDII